MSDRMKQVNEVILHKVGEFLSKNVETPRDVFITVTKINTSRDLRHATVFFNAFPDNKRGTAMRIMKKNKGKFQRFLSKNLYMKYLPNLHFEIDAQAIYGNSIDRMLDELDIPPAEDEQDINENLHE